MAYVVLETEPFSKLFQTLSKEEQDWMRKMIAQLEENPFVGKPLGFPWFLEKKFAGKRLYYLVYLHVNKVLLVAFGPKKAQQKIIDHILANRETYRQLVARAQ